MKTISSIKVGTSLVLSMVVVAAVAPRVVAVDGTAGDTSSKTTVCTRVDTLSQADTTTVSQRMATMQADFAKRLSSVGSKEDEVDQKVTAARTDATTKFDAKITTMKSKTGLTSSQLAAIDTFQNSVHTAQATRRTAVDAARTTYRNGLANAISANQARLSTAATTYQTAVSSAFTAAKASCSTDSTALTSLKSAVKTARETFAAATGKTGETTTQIRQLATVRDSAIKAADDAFKTTVQGLTVTLKSALKTS